jgi:hypothetical protein
MKLFSWELRAEVNYASSRLSFLLYPTEKTKHSFERLHHQKQTVREKERERERGKNGINEKQKKCRNR